MIKIVNSFTILLMGFGAGLTFGPHTTVGFWIWLFATVAFFVLSCMPKNTGLRNYVASTIGKFKGNL
jgi:hypothetical protein